MTENDPWIKSFFEAQDRWRKTPRQFEFRSEPGTILAINGGVAFMVFRDPRTGRCYNEHIPLHELKGVSND